jgi:hypothetical protein
MGLPFTATPEDYRNVWGEANYWWGFTSSTLAELIDGRIDAEWARRALDLARTCMARKRESR